MRGLVARKRFTARSTFSQRAAFSHLTQHVPLLQATQLFQRSCHDNQCAQSHQGYTTGGLDSCGVSRFPAVRERASLATRKRVGLTGVADSTSPLIDQRRAGQRDNCI